MALVPLFPLPGCVLLPGVVLPLHVFEERYRVMMRAVLARPSPERLIAVALLQRDFEPLYLTNHAPIHPTVCVGRVIEHQRLEDGRYNIMLLGTIRARIVEEEHTAPYRMAALSPATTVNDVGESEAGEAVQNLRTLLDQCGLEPLGTRETFDRIANRASGDGLAMLVDLLAYYLLAAQDCELKQQVLAESLLSVRVRILTRYLRDRVRGVESKNRGGWPPPMSLN